MGEVDRCRTGVFVRFRREGNDNDGDEIYLVQHECIRGAVVPTREFELDSARHVEAGLEMGTDARFIKGRILAPRPAVELVSRLVSILLLRYRDPRSEDAVWSSDMSRYVSR